MTYIKYMKLVFHRVSSQTFLKIFEFIPLSMDYIIILMQRGSESVHFSSHSLPQNIPNKKDTVKI